MVLYLGAVLGGAGDFQDLELEKGQTDLTGFHSEFPDWAFILRSALIDLIGIGQLA